MSGPRQARTVDPRIKSPLLYRLSYRPHCNLAKSPPNTRRILCHSQAENYTQFHRTSASIRNYRFLKPDGQRGAMEVTFLVTLPLMQVIVCFLTVFFAIGKRSAGEGNLGASTPAAFS